MKSEFCSFSKCQKFQFLEDFLCASSTALFLSILHLYPDYWFISLFALIPILWQLSKANLPQSIILGILLGSCYAFVIFSGSLFVSPWNYLINLFSLCLIFSLFCIAVSIVKKYTGFNPVFTAALWLALEHTLTHDPVLGNILTLPESDSGFLLRFGSLFGILMVSFLIALINSLILIVIKQVAQALGTRAPFPIKADRKSYLPFKQIIIKRHWYYFPGPRAPPESNIFICLQTV